MKTVSFDESEWQLVPVEATEEMLEAGFHAIEIGGGVTEQAWAALLAATPTPAEAPADVARWIDPNDKTQKQFLPHIGERVLFCHGGKTYYGKHTGGSFISFTNPGKNYRTWECFWMYPPKAIDAAIAEVKGGAK